MITTRVSTSPAAGLRTPTGSPTAPTLRARVLGGFDDPAIDDARWAALLARGATDAVFLTRQWLRPWWEAFGRGELLLTLTEREGGPAMLAPLYADEGMIFFVGSGGSDYLDFIGEAEPDVLRAALEAARAGVPDFVGFRFYHVPERSSTGARLVAVADAMGMVCVDEGGMPAPALDLLPDREAALEAANKKHLRRREHWLRREGTLDVRHYRDGAGILPHLDEFFAQHVTRWAETPYPSLFLDPAQRAFYEGVTRAAADTGWLRFTRIDWEGRPAAFHFGFCYRGSYLCYKPTYATELAQRAPGQVLFRQLLHAAIDEGAAVFDFGLGDEEFKFRFANRVEGVRTWGLYPAAAAAGA